MTLLLTSWQLFYEYRDQRDRVAQDFQRAAGLYQKSLAAAMWELNWDLVELQLDGLATSSSVVFVELTDASGARHESGNPPSSRSLREVIPVTIMRDGKPETLGELVVYAEPEVIYAYLRARIGMVLVSNAIKTFIVTLFLFWLFQQQVTGPLNRLARLSLALASGDVASAKQLTSTLRAERDDEIGLVLQSIEELHHKLTLSHNELRRKQWELAHAARLSTLGEMAASIAHELGQPLNSITNFAFAADMGLKSSSPADVEQACVYVRKIGGEAHRAGQILKNLRGFARLQHIEMEPHDLRLLVSEASDLLAHEAEALGIAVVVEPSREPLMAPCDKTQILQVLVNVIRNAFQSLAKAPVERRRLDITFRRQDGRVIVTVRDHGIGVQIGADQLFTSFATSKRDGLGLGLRICRNIMEAHQGEIWFEPAPVGAIFKIALPQASA